MKKDDLTLLKHVGAARMKLLNDSGITTFKALFEIPLENLAQIQTIGKGYAKVIKDAVTEFYEPPKKVETTAESGKMEKIAKIDRDLQKQIKTLNKRFKRTDKNLKPSDNKKSLEFYTDYENKSKTLMTRLMALEKIQGDLSRKFKKRIIKKADALNTSMKKIGKKPRKKTYAALSKEIESINKMFR